MKTTRRHALRMAATGLIGGAATVALGFPPPGRGPGRGRGPRGDENWEADHSVIEKLFEGHDKIRREITDLPNGVRTVTETDDPKLRALLQEHVNAMKRRVESGRAIRRRDPLFDAVFRYAEKIKMTVEETDKGVQVTETSDDPFAVKLVQAHARVVSLFVKNGHEEARRNHSVPKR